MVSLFPRSGKESEGSAAVRTAIYFFDRNVESVNIYGVKINILKMLGSGKTNTLEEL